MAVEDFRGLMRYIEELDERDPSTDVYVTLWRGDQYHSRADCQALEGLNPLVIRRLPLKLAKSLGYDKHC